MGLMCLLSAHLLQSRSSLCLHPGSGLLLSCLMLYRNTMLDDWYKESDKEILDLKNRFRNDKATQLEKIPDNGCETMVTWTCRRHIK